MLLIKQMSRWDKDYLNKVCHLNVTHKATNHTTTSVWCFFFGNAGFHQMCRQWPLPLKKFKFCVTSLQNIWGLSSCWKRKAGLCVRFAQQWQHAFGKIILWKMPEMFYGHSKKHRKRKQTTSRWTQGQYSSFSLWK